MIYVFKKKKFFETSNNDVIRNERDIIFLIKMQNIEFFEFSNKTVCKFEKFDDDKFENDKNKRKKKEYIT